MYLSVVIEKEDKFYVARIPELDVTTQGESFEKALANAKEAAELYLEDPDMQEKFKKAKHSIKPIVTLVEIAA